MKPVKEVFINGTNVGFIAIKPNGKHHWFSEPDASGGGRIVFDNESALIAGIKVLRQTEDVRLEDGQRD